MYQIVRSSTFKKQLKRFQYNYKFLSELSFVIDSLQKWAVLPKKYYDHNLKGNFVWCKECHISPDILLIYKLNNSKLELCLLNLWSHSDLF